MGVHLLGLWLYMLLLLSTAPVRLQASSTGPSESDGVSITGFI